MRMHDGRPVLCVAGCNRHMTVLMFPLYTLHLGARRPPMSSITPPPPPPSPLSCPPTLLPVGFDDAGRKLEEDGPRCRYLNIIILDPGCPPLASMTTDLSRPSYTTPYPVFCTAE